jgi:acyl carrier protein
MNEASVRSRLLECFRAVFPHVTDENLTTYSAETVSSWDSVTQVTLISVVEEDFGITVPEERYGQVTSFASLLVFLQEDLA